MPSAPPLPRWAAPSGSWTSALSRLRPWGPKTQRRTQGRACSTRPALSTTAPARLHDPLSGSDPRPPARACFSAGLPLSSQENGAARPPSARRRFSRWSTACRSGTWAKPTTWTVLQQDGPNHLGLWHNVLSEHQMALITSDYACGPVLDGAGPHGPTSNRMALITSDCGTMCSPSIKWP